MRVDAVDISNLRAAILRLARRLRNEGAGDDTLSATGVAVLGRLLRDGPQTLQVLATGEHVRPPSMTRIVDRLVELELVDKTSRPDDRRCVLVGLTDAGRAFLDGTRVRRTQWLASQIALLDDAETEALRRALGALQHLGEANARC